MEGQGSGRGRTDPVLPSEGTQELGANPKHRFQFCEQSKGELGGGCIMAGWGGARLTSPGGPQKVQRRSEGPEGTKG